MSKPPGFAQKVIAASSEQLTRFGIETPGITLAVLTTADGFDITCWHAAPATAARMAAMGSSLQALSEAITREAGLKAGRKLIIETDDGCVLAMSVGDARMVLSLIVVADKSASLGHLLWSTKRCCSDIARVVGDAMHK